MHAECIRTWHCAQIHTKRSWLAALDEAERFVNANCVLKTGGRAGASWA